MVSKNVWVLTSVLLCGSLMACKVNPTAQQTSRQSEEAATTRLDGEVERVEFEVLVSCGVSSALSPPTQEFEDGESLQRYVSALGCTPPQSDLTRHRLLGRFFYWSGCSPQYSMAVYRMDVQKLFVWELNVGDGGMCGACGHIFVAIGIPRSHPDFAIEFGP